MSGGLDLDENGYPDLLVGAYESDAVVLLRSKPIIKLSASLTVTPQKIDIQADAYCPTNGKKFHCVNVEICLNDLTDQKDR